MSTKTTKAIFLMWCPDQTGIVSRVTNFFYLHDLNIIRSQNYGENDRFFMRVVLDYTDHRDNRQQLENAFSVLADNLDIQWTVTYSDQKRNVAILVTKEDSCLYELLSLHRRGQLECNIPLIISNHQKLQHVAEHYGIPYFHLPIEAGNKREQELRIEELLAEYKIDLVVLARYMQVLSPEFCEARFGGVINIHHSFLPAFQGGRPYHQAFERGVKVIGATAHYVTQELDEGPIIQQDIAHVSHKHSTTELIQKGRDVERRVLTKAVQLHLEHRIVIYGKKTIIF